MALFSTYFFKHAQPALLYLVPCILLSSSIMALVNKDIKMLWNFNEEKINKEEEEEEKEDSEEEDKKEKKKEDKTEHIEEIKKKVE